MRTSPLATSAATLLLLWTGLGCEEKKTAAQLRNEKEKAWRTEQKLNAVKFYTALVKKYPDSPFSAQAKERLTALGPVATPHPGGH